MQYYVWSCDVVYTQREKARVLSMYNEMMRKRHGFLQLARHRIKKRVQQDKFWVIFYINFWFPADMTRSSIMFWSQP